MSRFLVTGGAGFIGSHITEKLVRDGHSVRVLDNFSSGRISNLKECINKIDLIKGDICSKSTCVKATRGMDFVLHQAALRSVPKSLQEPEKYNTVNIGGTLNMLEAARENKVRRFVFASSSSVYGDVQSFPEKEEFTPQPISPYALSKLAGEYYCHIFSCHYGLPTVALRYFNVFGPRQALDDEYAVVIPKFINHMLRNEPPPIYGTGRQSRDFTFISNVVEANLLAAKHKRLKSGVFNIASGRDYTILELVGILNNILGKKIRPVFLKIRPGDVFKTLAGLTRAKNILGFKPKVHFSSGLGLTVDYWRSNG
ncbi:MAG: SDR family oxidoreductase [Candidatus Omnitrophica bacterium]|jgi:nucleoside-diphosphate-sugar epimerase|nr:SDR family oxidoreductase [Candidatus Omnitrophota bacterium]MDD5518013.1 SDR family oxidoreductase [Candidatus Omnitrophota bacterium]